MKEITQRLQCLPKISKIIMFTLTTLFVKCNHTKSSLHGWCDYSVYLMLVRLSHLHIHS